MVTEHRRIVSKPPKLTDAERYRRFLDAAKELEASESFEDFDRAFNKVVTVKRKTMERTKRRPEGHEPR